MHSKQVQLYWVFVHHSPGLWRDTAVAATWRQMNQRFLIRGKLQLSLETASGAAVRVNNGQLGVRGPAGYCIEPPRLRNDRLEPKLIQSH